jgi:hypothetical protein
LAEGICSVLDDMAKYRPLTVRQVYYQLVAKLIIPNNLVQYGRVSRTLVHLRDVGVVPWSWIEDRTRRTTTKRGMDNVLDFIEAERNSFMRAEYYSRCYVQQQNVHIEVTTEKDALSSIMEDVTYSFCTRLNIIRGHASATIVEKIAGRLDDAIMRGKEPIILHMGDFDPSGIQIPISLKNKLQQRHDIDCRVEVIALNLEQIERYGLPVSPDALKPKDPNTQAWVKKYGRQQPVELDALKPDALQDILKAALSMHYDMSNYQEQIEQEKKDRLLIKQVRNGVIDYLDDQIEALIIE